MSVCSKNAVKRGFGGIEVCLGALGSQERLGDRSQATNGSIIGPHLRSQKWSQKRTNRRAKTFGKVAV